MLAWLVRMMIFTTNMFLPIHSCDSVYLCFTVQLVVLLVSEDCSRAGTVVCCYLLLWILSFNRQNALHLASHQLTALQKSTSRMLLLSVILYAIWGWKVKHFRDGLNLGRYIQK